MSKKIVKTKWTHNKHPYNDQPEYVLAEMPHKDPVHRAVELATVHRRTNPWQFERSKEEAEAIAVLIAAAPEMLETLKRVAEVFPQDEELFNTVRTLIAKVEWKE